MGATDWAALALAWGGPGLFVVAFVGATLVPVSSEVAFVAVLAAGLPVAEALAWASAGNCLGVSLNYALGRAGRVAVGARLEASRTGRAALRGLERYGLPALLLSWLPGIGDPLTVAAGVARVAPWAFALIAFPLRVGRYVLLAGLV